MNLPSQIENKLHEFITPKLYFTCDYNQYLFNDSWLIEITEETFRKATFEILISLNKHLVSGQNTKTFLNELRNIISNEVNWYIDNNINSLKFVDNICAEISIIENSNKTKPDEEKYSLKDILADIDPVIKVILSENNYYKDLYYFAESFNNYENPIDIEKVKLSYVLNNHYKYVTIIKDYIEDILENYDSIKFELYDFDELLFKYQIMEYDSNFDTKLKCNINLKKIEIAYLFYLLIDEKFIVFDRNEKQNKILLQQFIEQNFTYKDDDNKFKNIIKINKEFSKLLSAKRETQIDFIDFLISKLEKRKLAFK